MRVSGKDCDILTLLSQQGPLTSSCTEGAVGVSIPKGARDVNLILQQHKPLVSTAPSVQLHRGRFRGKRVNLFRSDDHASDILIEKKKGFVSPLAQPIKETEFRNFLRVIPMSEYPLVFSAWTQDWNA